VEALKGYVKLAHGSGGVEMWEILEKLVFPALRRSGEPPKGSVGIERADDAAAIPLPGGGYLVVSIDSYTVNPIFFPGGDIGVLAAAGSINDVLMMGGRPVAALDSIVVEEGFPLQDLERIVESMARVFREEGVAVLGGDFKVMPKGSVDRIVVTTAVIGFADRLIVDEPREGDKIIVTGYLGDHGAVILLHQMGGDVSESRLRSDVRPLTRLMVPLLEKYGDYVHAAGDPTRGGLAMTMNEWAKKTGTIIVVEEDRVPVRPEVESYAGILGIDPLYLASEGVAVLAVAPEVADEVLEFIRSLGFEDASIIGEVRVSERYKGYVLLRSPVGGIRILEPPRGELVPRIC
jgi:hydrogenase expression/formation protein HypE